MRSEDDVSDGKKTGKHLDIYILMMLSFQMSNHTIFRDIATPLRKNWPNPPMFHEAGLLYSEVQCLK